MKLRYFTQCMCQLNHFSQRCILYDNQSFDLFCDTRLKWVKSFQLRKKCSYSEFFWSVFAGIRTKYRDLLRKFPYSIPMRERTDQKKSEYTHFLRSIRIQNLSQLQIFLKLTSMKLNENQFPKHQFLKITINGVLWVNVVMIPVQNFEADIENFDVEVITMYNSNFVS